MIRMIYAACCLTLAVGGCMTDESQTSDRDGVAVAEQALSVDGPFASVDALVNFWTNNTSTGLSAVEVYVNGVRKYYRTGFGPELLKQYFVCANGIYNTCPSGYLSGFDTFSTLVSRVPSNYAIYQDGALFRAGTTSNTVDAVSVTTCSGTQGFNGPPHYFLVTGVNDPFVPYLTNCFPLQ